MAKDATTSFAHHCFRGNPPPCADICPLGIDIRDMVNKMQRGNFDSAFRTFRKAAIFPRIVAEICDRECETVCSRRDLDEAVDLQMLERALLDYSRNTAPPIFNVPRKEKRIAIVGAGLGGLACALRLATKKYQVEIFEQSDRCGGLCNELMSPEIVAEEIQLQFMHEQYQLHLNTEVTNLDELDHDAIFIATGQGDGFGLLHSLDRETWTTNRPGVFLGGRLAGTSLVGAIKSGAEAAQAIESYFKTGTPLVQRDSRLCSKTMKPDMTGAKKEARIHPISGKRYSKEEAIAESKRCLKCDCGLCYDGCEFMQHFHRYPKMLESNIATAFQEFSYEVERSKRMLNSCMNCGRCGDVCPEGLDIGLQLIAAKQRMHREGNQPPAYHDFWRRDLNFSLSEAFLAKAPAGQKTCRYLFFPGCQLGASQPAYVTESYRWLLAQDADTGILLSCCGALAEWSGDQELTDSTVAKLRAVWEEFGHPTLILACPSCGKMLAKALPQAKTVFIYEMMLRSGIPGQIWESDDLCVFDPCSSRNNAALQNTARQLSEVAGARLRELPDGREQAKCCGFGGLIDVANPSLAQKVVQNRVSMDEAPYITYCINCHDSFQAVGKPVFHLLDLICAAERRNSPPNVSQRRENRLQVKRELLKEYWNMEMEQRSLPWCNVPLLISEDVTRKLSSSRILIEDVQQVIWQAEQSGKKLLEPDSGILTAHLVIGAFMLWVRYRPCGEHFEIITAYGHRMSVEE